MNSTDVDMFGEQVPTEWYPDEYYGRTSHFVFTVNDCFDNCKSCTVKGLSINDQKCKVCLDGYYFVEGTENCFKTAPEGYFFNEEKKVYSKCFERCKTCSGYAIVPKASPTNIARFYYNCLSCYENYLLYNSTDCLNCKYLNKYVDYEQYSCIDSIPNG